jgi:hypothetical protein
MPGVGRLVVIGGNKHMNYWLFTVTEKKVDGGWLKAEEIFNQRISDKFWGLGERTPNRRNIRQGDRIVFGNTPLKPD